MGDYSSITSSGELSSPRDKKTPRAKKIIGIVFRTLLILLFVFVLALSGSVIYVHVRYRIFFVDGDSMYPTLNRNSTRPEGGTNDGTWGNFSSGYTCDYGIMDSQSGFVDSLKRFDIVVTYFDSDYDVDSASYANSLKIKRLIGLPGEELYFDLEGGLHVKEKGASDYVLVSQPSTINHPELTADSLSGIVYGSESSPCVLSDYEYFVCGDNRLHGASDDSRFEGPIGRLYSSSSTRPAGQELIQGRTVAILASCTINISTDSTGKKTVSSSLNWFSFKMPWDIQYL
jgi:signal peptidase I